MGYLWIPTWTHSQKSLAVSEAPRLDITSHRAFFFWCDHNNHPCHHKSNQRTCNEEENAPLKKVDRNFKKTSEFLKRGKAIAEQDWSQKLEVSPEIQDCEYQS